MNFKFDKKIFLENYGKTYIQTMKIIGIIDGIAIASRLLMLMTGITLPGSFGAVLSVIMVFVVITVFLVLPLIYCYYIKGLNTCKRLKMYFTDEGKLHVINTPEDGVVWGTGYVKNVKEYVINSIASMEKTSKYIVIRGDINYKNTYNGMKSFKHVEICKIPRCFKNENIFMVTVNNYY